MVYKFEAEIKKVPDIDGAYVVFPYDGSIVNMGLKNDDGSICYIIGIRKDIRQKINRQAGDKISVTVKPV